MEKSHDTVDSDNIKPCTKQYAEKPGISISISINININININISVNININININSPSAQHQHLTSTSAVYKLHANLGNTLHDRNRSLNCFFTESTCTFLPSMSFRTTSKQGQTASSLFFVAVTQHEPVSRPRA